MTTRVLQVDPAQPDPAVLEQAAQALRAGRLVAFPTETVYGLGANALDGDAVARIFEAKGRPATDPLIVHLAHIGQLSMCASHVPPAARKLGLAFWAGPVTIILPKQPRIPDSVTAGLPSVALRVPSHRVARALMEMAGVPAHLLVSRNALKRQAAHRSGMVVIPPAFGRDAGGANALDTLRRKGGR